jgi:hypothetical protein
VCSNEACDFACDLDRVRCDGQCLACPTPPNAVPVCSQGACGFVCVQGYADCNHDPSDGCEVYLSCDTANCGVCGHVCGGATPYCGGTECTDVFSLC